MKEMSFTKNSLKNLSFYNNIQVTGKVRQWEDVGGTELLWTSRGMVF